MRTLVIWSIMALSLVLSAQLAANNNEDPNAQKTKATDTSQEQTTSSTEAPQDTTAPTAKLPDKKAADGKSSDTFIPSESISEDLAVSFPVDI